MSTKNATTTLQHLFHCCRTLSIAAFISAQRFWHIYSDIRLQLSLSLSIYIYICINIYIYTLSNYVPIYMPLIIYVAYPINRMIGLDKLTINLHSNSQNQVISIRKSPVARPGHCHWHLPDWNSLPQNMSRNGRRKVPSSLAPCWHFGGENRWLNWKLTNTDWSCSHISSHLPFWSCWRDPCPLTLVCGAKGSEVGWPHPKKDSLRITIFSASHEELHCFTILFSQFGWNNFGKCGGWHCPTSNKGLHVCCQNAARKETRYRSERGPNSFHWSHQ